MLAQAKAERAASEIERDCGLRRGWNSEPSFRVGPYSSLSTVTFKHPTSIPHGAAWPQLSAVCSGVHSIFQGSCGNKCNELMKQGALCWGCADKGFIALEPNVQKCPLEVLSCCSREIPMSEVQDFRRMQGNEE